MNKYKVDLSWVAAVWGYTTITVEANNAGEARNIAEEADIDCSDYIKLIDRDIDVIEVVEVSHD